MAAPKLSSRFPTLVLNKFEDIEDAFRNTRDVLDPINRWMRNTIRTVNNHADRLTPATSTGVPTSTPTDLQLIHINTATGDAYISVGTSSSADWKKITP